MSSWFYCDCGRGLDPTPSDVIDGHIDCECGKTNPIPYGDDMMKDLLKQLVVDVEELKKGAKS